MKKCTKCKMEKDEHCFVKDKNRKDGLFPQCKECNKEYRKEHYKQNKEKINKYGKEYKKNNKKKINERNKEYRVHNKEKIKEYREDNKEKIKEYMKEYRLNNAENIRESKKRYEQIRKNTDVCYKLTYRLRKRISKAIKDNQKSGLAISELGCSIEELKQYLESIFKPGMSWKNHGSKGWHIDHVLPLSKFNLENREELLKACHYTNLQPLWWFENLSKSNKILGEKTNDKEST